jgi:hypothetical protein
VTRFALVLLLAGAARADDKPVRVALPLPAPLAAGFAAPGSRVDVVFPAADPKARVALEGAKVVALDSTTANGKTVHTATVELSAKQAEAVAPLLRAKAEPLVWVREFAKPPAALPKGCTLLALTPPKADANAFVVPGSRVDVTAREGRRLKVAFEGVLVFAVDGGAFALAVPLADAERAAALFRNPEVLALVLKKPDGK